MLLGGEKRREEKKRKEKRREEKREIKKDTQRSEGNGKRENEGRRRVNDY